MEPQPTLAGESPEPPEGTGGGPAGPDLVSIGLAVFFVAVILVVGALLLVPALA